MKLTRIQKKFINAVSREHGVQMPLSRQLLLRSRRWILLGLTSGGAALGFWELGLRSLALIFVGFWIGGVLSDFGWMLTGHRLWPVIQEITDWQKVDELAKGEDHSA
jgi:hypothetical protein